GPAVPAQNRSPPPRCPPAPLRLRRSPTRPVLHRAPPVPRPWSVMDPLRGPPDTPHRARPGGNRSAAQAHRCCAGSRPPAAPPASASSRAPRRPRTAPPPAAGTTAPNRWHRPRRTRTRRPGHLWQHCSTRHGTPRLRAPGKERSTSQSLDSTYRDRRQSPSFRHPTTHRHLASRSVSTSTAAREQLLLDPGTAAARLEVLPLAEGHRRMAAGDDVVLQDVVLIGSRFVDAPVAHTADCLLGAVRAALDVHTDCPGTTGDAVGRLLLLGSLDGFLPFVQRRLTFVQSIGTLIQPRFALIELSRPGVQLILTLFDLLLQGLVVPLQRAVLLAERIPALLRLTQLTSQCPVLRRLRGIWCDEDTYADAGRQGQHTRDDNPRPPRTPRASGSTGSLGAVALMPGRVGSPGTGSGGAAANGACSGGACANGACPGGTCWYGSKCSVGACGLSAAAVAPSGGAYGKG